MDPDLLTQLVRAGNDGVIPAALPGENLASYKFRAACAGAVVAVQWLEKTMAEQAKTNGPPVPRDDSGFNGSGLSGAAMGGGRPGDVVVTPGDVTVTSPEGTDPHKTVEEIDRILRRPALNGSGARLDDVGVD